MSHHTINNVALKVAAVLLTLTSFATCQAAPATQRRTEKSDSDHSKSGESTQHKKSGMDAAIERVMDPFYRKHYADGKASIFKSKVRQLSGQADTLAKQGKFKEAKEACTKAIEAFNTPEEQALYKTKEMKNFILSQTYSARGILELKMKEDAPATADFTKAIALCPDYATPYILRAEAYQRAGNKDGSAQDLNAASKLEKLPKFFAADIANSQSVKAAGKMVDKKFAALHAKHAEKYYTGGIKGEKASTMHNLGMKGQKDLEEGNFEQAADHFRAAIKSYDTPEEQKLFKSKPYADFMLARNYQFLAYAECMMKDYKTAVGHLDQAIKLNPNNRENYLNRAKALMLLGKDKEAKADFEKASHMQPGELPKFLHD